MFVNIVVAASENNVIGKNNKLLWNLPNDTAFFKNVTYGLPVIMGRKTLESLGKPLKGRTNIVITRDTARLAGQSGIVAVGSLSEAIDAAKATDALECSVIGGGQVYQQAMSITDRIYLTRVHAVLEGDTFFPEIDRHIWKLVRSIPHDKDDKHQFAYEFETWERI